MDSVALTAYLEAEWGEVLEEFGITAAYIVGLVEEVSLADTTLAGRWAEPLADYYLLRRAVRASSPDLNVSPRRGGSYDLGARHQRLRALYEDRRAEVAWIVDANVARRGQVLTLVGDYLTGDAESEETDA